MVYSMGKNLYKLRAPILFYLSDAIIIIINYGTKLPGS